VTARYAITLIKSAGKSVRHLPEWVIVVIILAHKRMAAGM
jgi:hypothetical protein